MVLKKGNYNFSKKIFGNTKNLGRRKYGYLSLYRFVTKFDVVLIIAAIFLTIVRAIVLPINTIVFSDVLSVLVDRVYGHGISTKTILLHYFGGGRFLINASSEENYNEIKTDVTASFLWGILITATQFIASVISIDLFNRIALKLATRIRINALESLMRQEIGWYDVTTENNASVLLTEDVKKIQSGIDENVGHCLRIALAFTSNMVLSFCFGWELTLLVIAGVPIMFFTNFLVHKIQAKLTRSELDIYAIASNLAEEVLGGIRTVVAFCGEKNESERYDNLLHPARKKVAQKGIATGFGEGMARFLCFAGTSLIYWYGLHSILDERDKADKKYAPGVVIIVFFATVYAVEDLTRVASYFERFVSAQAAGGRVFEIIDRISKIDPMAGEGKFTEFETKGDVEFRDINFSYPSRPDITVLQNLSLKIKCEQIVALVGSSGNGKSTCLQLLLRFYDPNKGKILIDECDIRNFDVPLLRSKIAMVGQEPVLFSTTISENIRYGNPNATYEQIVAAAHDAGAHDFISNLAQGYDTLVGEKGCQLSGGEKQRIAIARALIQNPKILLLDEATSALDYESEKSVQAALDLASKGRTTIVVSHRPSAIRNASRIIFIENGTVVEDGGPEELFAAKGRYYDMFYASDLENDRNVLTNRSEKSVQKIRSKTKAINEKQINEIKRSAAVIDENQAKISEQIHYGNVFRNLLRWTKPEWLYLFFGVLCAIITGISYPVYAVLFGEILGSLSEPESDELNESIQFLCILSLVFGVVTFITLIAQYYFFCKTAVCLGTRLRSITFSSMLSQEMAWFDDAKNGVGALSARLNGDASSVHGAFGYPICSIIQSFTAFVVGISIAYSYYWKLATTCLIPSVLAIALVILQGEHMTKTKDTEKAAMEQSARIAAEAVSNIRTVASLRQETHVITRYASEMQRVENVMKEKLKWRGCVCSASLAVVFLSFSFGLYYGGHLLSERKITLGEIFKVSQSINYGAVLLSWATTMSPAITAAIVSCHYLAKIIYRKPKIVSPVISDDNQPTYTKNSLTFKDIDFYYPTRPNVQILQQFSLHVPEGKTIALVGSSGSGKSTCMQILERFYDPQHGHVYVGNDNIFTDISLTNLRSRISIVSQEPVLFDRSIADNIAYGCNEREVTMVDIIEAAKMANIHEFIASLPLGYETKLGAKGAQLSGGQKQRIAIARALIRNPKILLLDEATSALDLQNEQIVQQALDVARQGRTCLTIAHRLSTIQNADLICVLQHGCIAEQGTHAELLSANGIYVKLCRSHEFK